MAFRTIRLSNDPILRKKSKPVKEINTSVLTLLDDMVETLVKMNGIGLASPQIGILKRIAVIDAGAAMERGDENVDDQENAENDGAPYILELINPEIIETEGIQKNHEACLSIPGQSGMVERPARVIVKATNRFGEEFTVEGTDVLAVAFCHELDHLDGVLYTDKATEIETDEVSESGTGKK